MKGRERLRERWRERLKRRERKKMHVGLKSLAINVPV